jgi:hypothetical protein
MFCFGSWQKNEGENGSRASILQPKVSPRLFAQERARRDAALAARLEMENEVRTGELCEISAVAAVVARDYNVTKNKLMNIASKIAPALAKADTPAACFEIVDSAIRRALDELCADEAFEEIERRQAGDLA